MTDLLIVIRQYTLYAGYFLLVTGVVGNLLNIYLLSSIRSYRTKPSTFYFLIASIYNTIIIVIGLVSRIIESGYGINISDTSLIWCKFRHFFVASIPIIPAYLQCFATIDQYLITSQRVKVRQHSSIKRSYVMSFILSVVSLLHGIPFGIYYEISKTTKTCLCTHVALLMYLPIFVLVIFLFLPTIITMIFGYLTYRNISQSVGLTRQQADRQLTKMIFIQIFLIASTSIPYGFFHIYSMITIHSVKDQTHLLIDEFILTIVSLNTYFYSGGGFYVFLLSSSRFRQLARKRIFFWQKSSNQIKPHK